MKNTKMKIVTEEKVEQQNTKIIPRVLGGDITNTSFEELEKTFDEFMKNKQETKYPVKLTSDEIGWITMNFIPTLEWKGQNVYDIIAFNEGVNAMISDTEVQLEKEKVKAVFHFIANGTFKGANELYIIRDVLSNLGKVIQMIHKDEQDIRDAGFELNAAEQGILPENLANGN